MNAALLAVRLVLVGVFTLSGAMKLADRPGTSRAMREFGLPQFAVESVAFLLPIAELAVAVSLIFPATAWYGGIGALALLGVFTVAILGNLARGRRPDCHCFGQLSSEPIGPTTVLRNLILMAPAVFLLAHGPHDAGPSFTNWVGDLSTGEAVAVASSLVSLAIAGAVLWLITELVGQNGRLLEKLEAIETRIADRAAIAAPAPAPALSGAGLPTGVVAPDFDLPDIEGRRVSLRSLLALGRPAMLVFTDPECGPCNALMPDLGRWSGELGQAASVVVISRGSAEANGEKTAGTGLASVLMQADRETATAYQANATPSAVFVRQGGAIGSSLAQGADQIRSLVTMIGDGSIFRAQAPAAFAANGSAPCPQCGQVHGANGAAAPAPVGVAIGQPAPAVKLPDLDGKSVELAAFKGSRTVLLFWNPGCGFCQALLNDVKAWETDPSKDSVELLVISTGSADENRALGFKAPVLLDSKFSTGPKFGVQGTPSAVLVDEKGLVASPVAVGAPPVLSLIRPS